MVYKILLALLFGHAAVAQDTLRINNSQIFVNGQVNRNYIKNSGAEAPFGVTGLTVVNGTVTKTSISPIYGNSEFTIDASAAGNTATWDSEGVDFIRQGQTCETSMWYEGDASLYVFEVLLGGTLLQTNTLSNVSTPTKTEIIHPCGNLSATTNVRVRATADAPAIRVDNVYTGLWNGEGVSQTSLYGTATYAVTTNCSWSRTGGGSSTIGAFSADADCPTPTVTANASAPATKIPGITFASLPPGEYMVFARGYFAKAGASADYTTWAFNDGTSTTSAQVIGQSTATIHGPVISGRFSYTAAQSNITIQVYAATNTTSNSAILDVTAAPLTIEVIRLPSQSELVQRTDAFGVDWTSYSPVLAGSTNGSTFTNQTTTGFYRCDGGNLEIQIYTAFSGAPGAGTGYFTYSLPSAFTIDTAKIPTATLTKNALGFALGLDAGTSFYRGIVGYENSTELLLYLNDGANQASPTVPFTVANTDSISLYATVPVTAGSPCSRIRAPMYVGSVTSNSTGAERVERVKLAAPSGGACAVTSESGDWISGTPTSSGTGICSVTISANIFSATPTCVCSGTTAGQVYCRVNPTSATAVEFRTGANNVDTNSVIDAVCMGPK